MVKMTPLREFWSSEMNLSWTFSINNHTYIIYNNLLFIIISKLFYIIKLYTSCWNKLLILFYLFSIMILFILMRYYIRLMVSWWHFVENKIINVNQPTNLPLFKNVKLWMRDERLDVTLLRWYNFIIHNICITCTAYKIQK